MAIQAIESLENLRSLKDEWLKLWQESSTATPFQSPDWIIPWWKYFGSGRLCVLVWRNDAGLLGIAPLFAYDDDRRSLRFIGTGNTDYLDIIVDDRARNDCGAAIFNYLSNIHSWHDIDLEGLPCNSPLLRTMRDLDLDEEVDARVEEQDACPVLSLPRTATEFIDDLPHRLQHNLSYYRRKLAMCGEVMFEQAVENNFDELFEALLSLHKARWRMTNSKGVLFADDVQSFHRDAAFGLLSHGALRLYSLRIDGRVIACLYGFHHAQRTYYYLSGFDPEFAQYSPGNILVAHAIHEAIREGATEFDFLRGRESYKYKWGAIDQPIYHKHLTRIENS